MLLHVPKKGLPETGLSKDASKKGKEKQQSQDEAQLPTTGS